MVESRIVQPIVDRLVYVLDDPVFESRIVQPIVDRLVYALDDPVFESRIVQPIVDSVTSLRAGRSGVQIPVRAIVSCLIRNVQTGSSPPSQYSVHFKGFSLTVKRLEREVDHYRHIVPRLRMSGAIPPLLLYAFMTRRRTNSSTYLYLYLYYCTLSN